MTSIKSYGMPFTSEDGDRKYSALEWREYFSQLIRNGLIQNADNQCQVKPQAAPNKTVYVDTGVVFINGAMRILEEPITLTVAENTSGNPRIDRVVARLNEASRTIEFAVKQGTPAGSPIAPALTRVEGVYELGLADITLANGYSTITSGVINDKRWDASLCGASSMTIGVIPPSGLEAETVTLNTETSGLFGVGNVDGALALLGNAKWYGKYIKLSLASSKSAGDIAFSTKENDDFNITNLTTYPTRLFVPSGAKKVRISANIQATCYPNKHFKVSLYKNTTKVKDFLARESTQGSGETDTKHNSEIFDVVDGDYFKLNVTDNTNVMFSNCTFTLEVIN